MGTTVSLNIPTSPRISAARSTSRLDQAARRLIDILVAFFGLLFLSPIFLLIAILLRRDSAGPIFYHGPRVGKNGREFGILKFRTMYERPESYTGPSVTGSQDDRITPFGHWLRDTKVNELPQLWNVLVGDMSLVGPRPEDPKIAKEWPPEVREEMFSVRPGVTSPASILYREEEKLLSSNNLMEDYFRNVLPSKLRLDLLYIRRRSILNDLDIIFLTMIALLPQLRKRTIPERVLYNGPLSQVCSKFLNWFCLDWLASTCAVMFAGLLWRLSGPLDLGFGRSLVVALLTALVFSLSNLILGLNRTVWRTARAAAAIDLGLSAGFATLTLVVVNHFSTLPTHLPEGMLVLSGVLSFIGFVAARYRERVLTGIASRWISLRGQARTLGERVLIIGAGEMGNLVSWLVKHGEFARAFNVTGYVDDDPRKVGLVMDGSPVLGMTSELPDLIQKYDVGLIIFAISNISAEQRKRILSICKHASVQVVFFPNILEEIRSSLLPDYEAQPTVLVEREDVSQMLDELDALLEQGDLDRVRSRMTELRKIYTTEPEAA